MATRARWRKSPLDLAKAGTMLRDYARGCDGDPLEAFVFRDTAGRHRRISARYGGGWSLRVHFRKDGSISSYQLACSLRFTVRK